jgi:hypothetical protein
MKAKHIHQDDFRCCLWSIDRSAPNILKGRGPRMRFHRILRQGPRAVLLERAVGNRLFKRADLNGNKWSLYETPAEAVEGFGQRAEHWRDRALAEVAWADRDLAFVAHRSMDSILPHAKEGT